MAKVAFTVDNGLVPGHTDADLGHTAAKFRDVHLSRDGHVDNNLNVGGNVALDAGGDVTIGGTTIQGGGGGGGIDEATSIAYSIALG